MRKELYVAPMGRIQLFFRWELNLSYRKKETAYYLLYSQIEYNCFWHNISEEDLLL
jgi:hypothetical protein